MSGQSHRSDPRILHRRTLERDHRRLAEILRPGMSVLDVGCGTGAITSGIAKAVAPGLVVGLDRDLDNLAFAREHSGELPNLHYELGDALSLPFGAFNTNAVFDIVTAARTLQWISEPSIALANMQRAAKPGGRVVVLDYNLADNRWEPGIPAEFGRFYAAFLDWRTSNLWNNHMADHLLGLFREAGLNDVQIHVSDEIAERGDPDFAQTAGIWTYVTSTLGPRIAAAGFVTEAECAEAEHAYLDWVAGGLTRQTLVMRTVEGTVPQ
jgi:SAM-dependent methyltransferase